MNPNHSTSTGGKTILVTGAGGFIGRALCSELSRRGYRVRGAMRTHGQLSVAGETVTVGAIDASTKWGDALRNVDTVIHLAARVHVMKDKAADPLTEYLKVNLYGTSNLARQAADAGVKRMVYVSTIKVNGETTLPVSALSPGTLSPSPSPSPSGGEGKVAFSETDEPDPQDPYAISKMQSEQVLHKIAGETGLEAVIVRPPLVYGPGVKGNFLRLLDAIDKGMPLPLAGANNLRSMVYVGNLVDALIACATHPAAAGQTYLVSDGEDISTVKLVETICRSLGRNNRMFYLPPGLMHAAAKLLGRADQIERLFGSLRVNDQKLRREQGWKPPYTMEQGMRATVDWYRGRNQP
ncbi:MAG TPA: SDR family oxidoreductase [Gallionella sp.]|nr:SDR family oxidoreductase [Gallionella sp.]